AKVWLFFAFQLLIEEPSCLLVRVHPILPEQQVVNLVGINNLLVLNSLRLQSLHKIYSLVDGNIAIVVAMNQQNRGTPLVDRGVWRRSEGELPGLFHIRRLFRKCSLPLPVVYAVEVDSRFKNFGVASKTHCREESTVRAAPQPNSLWIDIGQCLEIVHAGKHIVVFRSATPSCVGRLTKVMTIHDAEPVVHRQNCVSQIGKILILGICVVVVVHVVEAKQHLARWSAMSKDQRGTFAHLILWYKKLAVDCEPIAALEGDLLRNDQLT